MEKIWKLKKIDTAKSSALAKSLDLVPLVAELLVSRGIETEEDAITYLHPQSKDLHSPFLLPDMKVACERIKKALDRKEQIYIYGDYDVDGITSTALLINIFRSYNYPIKYYIPNRFEDGYGLNKKAIQNLKGRGCDLLITVDCGITAVDEVIFANSLGMDIIITDHHQLLPGKQPPGTAIITPRRVDSNYPFTELTGVGLAFKLAHALSGRKDLNSFLRSQLDLVALGTVADVAPLVGENRILVSLGLSELNKRIRPGTQALCDASHYDRDKKITSETLGFALGPRINAAGRMMTAHKAVKLLTSESYQESILLARELDSYNIERKEIQSEAQDKAILMLEQSNHHIDKKGLVVACRDWHRGIIGIVASRIRDRYYRPTLVLSIDGEEAHGSGRSIDGMNLVNSLRECEDLLIKYGGHAAAAGLTLKTRNIKEFASRFNNSVANSLSPEDLVPKLEADIRVDINRLTLKAIKQLECLQPFGAHNVAPRFLTYNLTLDSAPVLIGKDQTHLKLLINNGTENLDAIGWGMADLQEKVNLLRYY